MFHVNLPLVYGSDGYDLAVLPHSQHLCEHGGCPVGSCSLPLPDCICLVISSGCKNASLHQAGFFLDFFRYDQVTDKNHTNLVSRCLIESALAVTFQKSLLMSQSIDLWWGGDGSSHHSSWNFFASMVGGTTLVCGSPKHWYHLLNFSEIIMGGGAETLLNVVLASLKFINFCQKLLQVPSTKIMDFFACLTDGASENAGEHQGLHHLFVKKAKEEWIADGFTEDSFIEPLHKKCDAHLVALFSTEFDK